MIHVEKVIGDFLLSSDKSLLDVNYIHNFICHKSYWAQGVPLQIVERAIANSLCFGVYHNKKQIGFARLVTDYATFGYLADVFIDEGFRGRGLSKELMELIFGLPDLHMFRRVILATKDAHGLYTKYGFTPLRDCSRFMEKHQPDVYMQLKSQPS